MTMVPSKNCLDLIKKFEGCKLAAYQDVAGIWTIGYGTTGPGIREGLQISQGTAEAMLLEHVRSVGIGLLDLIGRRNLLNQNQFDALTCFIYNIGIGNFKSSTCLKDLLANKVEEAATEILRWDKVHGKQVQGLTARRLAEHALFIRPNH